MQEEPSIVMIGLKPCALQRMRGGSYLKFYLIHQIAGPVRDAAIYLGRWAPFFFHIDPGFSCFFCWSRFPGSVDLKLPSVWTRYHARVSPPSIVNAVRGLFLPRGDRRTF